MAISQELAEASNGVVCALVATLLFLSLVDKPRLGEVHGQMVKHVV